MSLLLLSIGLWFIRILDAFFLLYSIKNDPSPRNQIALVARLVLVPTACYYFGKSLFKYCFGALEQEERANLRSKLLNDIKNFQISISYVHSPSWIFVAIWGIYVCLRAYSWTLSYKISQYMLINPVTLRRFSGSMILLCAASTLGMLYAVPINHITNCQAIDLIYLLLPFLRIYLFGEKTRQHQDSFAAKAATSDNSDNDNGSERGNSEPPSSPRRRFDIAGYTVRISIFITSVLAAYCQVGRWKHDTFFALNHFITFCKDVLTLSKILLPWSAPQFSATLA